MTSYSEIKDWVLPKVSKEEIYETKSSIFSLKKDYSIKTTEHTILLPHSQQPIQLFNPKAIQEHQKKYKFLHIGLVQVGIRPLSREYHDTSVLLCLRDKRILDFDSSIISVLESTLAQGPVHFDYYPNMMVSLEDPKIMQVLSLFIKFHNLEIQGTTFPFVLVYRIHYKCMQNPTNSAAKKSSYLGETRIVLTRDKRTASASVEGFTCQVTLSRHPSLPVLTKTIRWSDVQFPEEWKLQDEYPPESQEYVSPPRIEFQGGFRTQV